MKRCLVPIIVLLLLAPASVSAFGYVDAHGNGSAIPGYNAVSLALGGARAIGFGDALSVLTNPADIYRIPGTSFSISIGPAVVREQVEDSLGKHDRTWISLGSLSGAVKLQVSPQLAVAAGVARVSDFSYDGIHYAYDEEPGPEYGRIIEVTELKVVGGLYESAVGFAWRPATWLNVGLSGGLRFGSVSFDSTFEDRNSPENDTLVSWSYDESEFCWHGGLVVPLGLSRFGVCYTSAGDHYDSRVAGGALLYTDDSRQGAFGAEVEIIDPGEINALVIRVLGQFTPSDNFTVRGSLFFSDRGDEVDREGLGIALGTGISFGKLTLNGGYSWSTVTRNALAFGYEAPEDIKDTPSILSIGLTWNP